MLSTLHRYVLWELVRSFVLSFAALVAVMLVGSIYRPLRHGIGFGDLLAFLPYLLPYLYAWVLPAAMLAACVMTYGRLSAENELTAICTSGVPLRYACYPAFLLALILTALAIPLNDWLIPYCRVLKERELRTAFLEEPFRATGLGQVTTKIGGYKIYVESVQGDLLHNVVVIEPKDKPAPAPPADDAMAPGAATPPAAEKDVPTSSEISVYRAEYARYSVDPDERTIRIVLQEAACTIVTPGRPAPGWFNLTAKEQVIAIPTLEAATVNFGRPSNSTTAQLLHKAAELERERLTSPEPRKKLQRDIARTLTEVRLREALSFATIALCLVGIPLGIWMRQSNRLRSFAVAIVVFLLLYGMIAGGEGLATARRLSPRLALWTPDALTGAFGLAMLLYTFRR